MNSRVVKRLESIDKLPTLPAVIENLGAALGDPEIEAEQIAAIIEDDPAIMARIMKVVNSAMYLGVSETVSLRTAIVRLGFRAVSNIAMSAAVFSTFVPNGRPAFDRTAFWRHCIAAGIGAEELCGQLPRFSGVFVAPDVLHLCGLLHDMGKIVFEQYFHDQFVEALYLSKIEKISLYEAEKRIMGADHAQAGAWLAGKWRLPEAVSSVIRWHHNPAMANGKYRDLVWICAIADRIVNMGKMGDGGNLSAQEDTRIQDEIDLDHEHLVRIINLIESRAQQSPLLDVLGSGG
jgi:putative nucleotidyltransferase with HDIG domain